MLLLLSVLTGAATNRLSILIVDDDGPADFSTIQAAVDAAQPGDTVLVKPGTYQESVLIENKTDLTVRGTHRDSVRVLRIDQQSGQVMIVFVSNSERITMQDMHIVGAGVADAGVAINLSTDITVRRTLMTGMGASFVSAGRSQHLRIVDNKFVVGAEFDQAGPSPPYLDFL